MGSFVNSLTGTSGINADTVGANLSMILPVIAIFFGIGLTMYIVRKLLRSGSKLKFKI